MSIRTSSPFISPIVGQDVWYRPSVADCAGAWGMRRNEGHPLAAKVVAVWSDCCVNVLVTDTRGRQFPRIACELMQAGHHPQCDATGKLLVGYVDFIPTEVNP